MAVRRAEARDHVRLRALGFEEATLSPRAESGPTRIYVIEEAGEVVAAACGSAPRAGDAATLGAVVMPGRFRRDWFRALVRALAAEAVELGFSSGEATVRADNDLILGYLREAFGLVPEPAGWEPNSGYGVVKLWRYRVDLRTLLSQLGG